MGNSTASNEEMRRQSEWKKPVAAIFIHAGAGYHSTTNEKVHLQACNDAAKVAMRCLKNGGEATVAVELAIRCLEDKEITNAGFGSNLNMDGTVECDATVVDHHGRSGACGAVPGIKNPISLAKIILETSGQRLSLRRVPPNILVGHGAQAFAQQHGLTVVPNSELVSKNAKDRYDRWAVDLQTAETRDRAWRAPTPVPVGTLIGPGAAPLPKAHREHFAAILNATWNEGQPDSPYHSGASSEQVSAQQSSAASPARDTPLVQPPSPHALQSAIRSPLNLMPPTRASRSSSLSKRARPRHTDDAVDSTPSSPCSPPKKRARTSANGIPPHDSPMSEGVPQFGSPPTADENYDPWPRPGENLILEAKSDVLHAQYRHIIDNLQHWQDLATDPDFLAAEAVRPSTPPPRCICCPQRSVCLLQPVEDELKFYQRRKDWETVHASTGSYGTSTKHDEHGNAYQDDEDIINDTVGAIAIDLNGHIAAGSSSGGIGMKHVGRVGPAALVGIGTAVIPVEPADPFLATVAAVTSGTGEHMATTLASYKCAERLYHSTRRGPDGHDLPEDDEDAIMESFVSQDFMGHPGVKNQPSAGAIGVMAVKKMKGGYYFYFAHNTDSFALASQSSEERVPLCVMSRTVKSGDVIRGGRKIRVD